MRNRAAGIVFLAVSMLLAGGCAQANGTAGTFSSNGQNPIPTGTRTPKPTATLTQTVTPPPTFTPTSSIPRDLELKDVSIYPQTFDAVGQWYYLFGRIRNNTDTTMTFSDRDLVFEFTFEVWAYNSETFAQEFWHAKYNEELRLKPQGYRQMNCILYPGEEGVFYYWTNSNRGPYLIEETMKDYSGPLGIWYSYKSYSYPEPDLPTHYHPGTENLTFTKENGELIFDYDIVDIPRIKHLDIAYRSGMFTWVILYDQDGKILYILWDVLPSLLGGEHFDEYSATYHVHSDTAYPSSRPEYFHRAFDSYKLTPEIIAQVDHLEAFTEFEEEGTCMKYRS
jgi:hypothetical protein